ncbi:MAG: RIP metalloprotease RseP [Saprospiraceae bacterium]|nr:RIP metalloprotease RseP [Saprospiraceae bacterium]
MIYLVLAAQLILSLSILVILHELGHFLPAKWFKTRVEKFYLFFDPWLSLIKAKKINNKWEVKSFLSKNQEFSEKADDVTEYGVGWLPLGGYVKISGMVDESMDKEQLKQEPKPWEFRSKPAWQRLIIMLGGVTVNFLLGFIIFGFLLFKYGEEYLPAKNATYGIHVDSIGREMGLENGDEIIRIASKEFDRFDPTVLMKEVVLNDAKTITVKRNGELKEIPIDQKYIKLFSSNKMKDIALFQPRIPFVVMEVPKDKPAFKAGIKKDDKIIGLNNEFTPFYGDFFDKIKNLKNTPVEVTVLRGADTLKIAATTTQDGRLGIAPYAPSHYFKTEKINYSLLQAIPAGVGKGVGFLSSQIKAFGQMFSGKIDASESLGGFASIAKLFPEQWNWEEFWHKTAILSLILAFMNLLPIPGLDGGYVVFLIWEVVTGKKVSDEFMEKAVTVGFVLLMALMLYANGLDVVRLWK